MQLPVEQFPILEPGQMNPFHQALQSGLQNYMNATQAAYYPLTLKADAASKMAYANLMGPQFTAKLLGNESILSNLPDDQKNQLLQLLVNAGTKTSSLPGKLNLGIPSDNSPWSNQPAPSVTNNAPVPMPASPVPMNTAPPAVPAQTISNPQTEQGKAIDAWLKSPKAMQQMQNDGMVTIPDQNKLLNWYRGLNQPSVPVQPASLPVNSSATAGSPQPTKSFAENTANYESVVSEGKEMGKIRANDIKDLGDTYQSGINNQTTLDQVSDILSSPAFEQIRQLPLASQHELAFYAKEGTPDQQRLVGKYYALTGNIIKDSSRDFRGQFRVGEQKLLEGMKPSPSDTIDTAKGKVESLSYLNQMLTQRSRLASQLMSQYHMNKADALDMADRSINGASVRQQIVDRLNPTVTLRNPKTGQMVTVPVSEARKGGFNG